MAALKYETLDADAVAAIAAEVTAPATEPVVTPGLLAAWEKDHAAHAALYDAATDEDQREVHREAMRTLEAAIRAGRKSVVDA